jgi:flagellar biosynthesis anti-sigma factor FlgM
MKIDANGSAPDPAFEPRKTSPGTDETGSASQAGRPGEDHTSSPPPSSFDHVNVGALASQAMESPEVRLDKVDSLRQAIRDGQYKVAPDKVAEAMLRESPKL